MAKYILVKTDSFVQVNIDDWDEVHSMFEDNIEALYYHIKREDDVEEEHGAVLFHGENKEDVPFNDNINLWLKEVTNQMWPLLRGDVLIIGLSYNGEAKETDVGSATLESFNALCQTEPVKESQ